MCGGQHEGTAEEELRERGRLLSDFRAVQENKPFIMNVYRCVDRQKIESYLNKLTYQLIADVVEEKCRHAVSGGTQGIHCRILQIWFCGCDVRLDRPGNEG